MSREIILIDLGSVFWAAWHSSANEAVSAAHDRAVNHVRRIANGNPFVAVCCDSPKSWRKRIAPTYKAQRGEKDLTSIEQLNRTKETLRRDGFLLWEAEGFEADDVAATASVKAKSKGDRVALHSADKDLLQLVSDTCTVFTTSTGVRMDAAAVKEKWGVNPEQMADALAICGDKSDNIAGVPGVGPVGAAKLLNRFGTIEALIAELEKPEPIATPAVDKALRESVVVMQLAKRLTILSWDVPIKYEELFEERHAAPLTDETEDYMPNLDQTDETFDDVMGPEIKSEPQQQTQIVPRDAEQTATPQQPGVAKTGALARDTGLQPQSLGAALDFAKAIYNSRLYSKFNNPEAIFAVIVRGREMGLGALTALDAFDVVEGRPAPKAHLIIARAKAHPDCEYFSFIGGDEKQATYETKNRNNPNPTRLTYTIEQARLAGRAPTNPRRERPQGKDDRGQWEKVPAEMIRKSCGVQLARIEYPDAALGLVASEELDVA